MVWLEITLANEFEMSGWGGTKALVATWSKTSLMNRLKTLALGLVMWWGISSTDEFKMAMAVFGVLVLAWTETLVVVWTKIPLTN